MKTNGIDFDQIVLKKYKDSFYENLISDSLNGYKQIFLLVYDKYNSRFKQIYNEDLFIIHYYIEFLDLFSKEAKTIIKEIPDDNKKKKFKNNEQADDYFNNYLDAIVKAKILFVENEEDFDYKIKADKGIRKIKKLYIGLVKEDIFNFLDTMIFLEVDYFIRIAEHKKFIYDPYKKHYEEFNRIFMTYIDYKERPSQKTKNKEIISAIKKVKPDTETASGGSSYQQMAKRFIKTKKYLDSSILEINEAILKNLRELNLIIRTSISSIEIIKVLRIVIIKI